MFSDYNTRGLSKHANEKEKDVDTLFRFFQQVKDMTNDECADEIAVFQSIRCIANSLNIEENTNTTEKKEDDTINLLGFILKTQLEIQKEKDPRVLYCSDLVKEFLDECPIISDDKFLFYKTLHDHAEALNHEAIELINWLPWKGWTEYLGNSWDKTEGNIQLSPEHIYEMQMEAIDCLKFLSIIFIILDMDLPTIKRLFVEKTKIKKKQWEKENGKII